MAEESSQILARGTYLINLSITTAGNSHNLLQLIFAPGGKEYCDNKKLKCITFKHC